AGRGAGLFRSHRRSDAAHRALPGEHGYGRVDAGRSPRGESRQRKPVRGRSIRHGPKESQPGRGVAGRRGSVGCSNGRRSFEECAGAGAPTGNPTDRSNGASVRFNWNTLRVREGEAPAELSCEPNPSEPPAVKLGGSLALPDPVSLTNFEPLRYFPPKAVTKT